MGRIILYFICWFIAGGVIAQEQLQVPDFAKIPEENRYDSINQWYIDSIAAPGPVERKRKLMAYLREYADHTNDRAVKTSTLFFFGHFAFLDDKDSTRGMHDMFAARDMAEKYHLQYEWASFTHALGNRFFESNPAMGLEYMLRSHEVMANIGASEKASVLVQDHTLGTFLFYIRNYTGCIQTLLPVLHAWERTNISRDMLMQVNNTIGLAYRESGQPDSAMFYFRKAMAQAERPPRFETWVGIVAGNIGSLYFKQNLLDSALAFAQLNYDLVKNDPGVSGVGVAEPLILLASIHIEQHQPDLVIKELLLAEKLIKGLQLYYAPNAEQLRLKVYFILARAYDEKGEYKTGNSYLQKALTLQEELSHKENTEVYAMVQAQVEAEKSISKMREAEDTIKLSEQRRNFFITGLSLTGLILLTLYGRQRMRNRKNRELFESREQLLFLEKKRAEENLAAYMENLEEKNRLIEHVQKEMELLDETIDTTRHEMVETLDKLKQSTLLTAEDWEAFSSLFEKVHGDFFSKLKDRFPDITPAETRMMALVKLDMPVQKMANMLGISVKSIRKTQYRFARKINASGLSDITDIVNTL